MASPFFILTGFLGSGKTTLLLDYLATPSGADTAVLVNDVGAIDVDGVVVAGNETGMPVAILANGCVCCSIGNQLVTTVANLIAEREASGSPPFKRFILECSGLSKPSPVIRSLAELGAFHFRVRVLATFDVNQSAERAASFAEAAAQLTSSQTIVLSKIDDLDEERVAKAIEAARAFGPFAHIIAETNRPARAIAAFDEQRQGGEPANPSWPMNRQGVPDGGRNSGGNALASDLSREALHPRIGVFTAHISCPMDWPKLSYWIEDLAAFCGDRLLRVKGLASVNAQDGAILIQGVGTIFSPPLRVPIPPGAAINKIVVIAADMTREELSNASEPHGIRITET